MPPYKFTEEEKKRGYGLSSSKMPHYHIPDSCRFTVPRSGQNASNIVFYWSKPKRETYPIAFLCGGSTNKESLESVIHFHRYFLQECLDMDLAVITVELWGIDGASIYICHERDYLLSAYFLSPEPVDRKNLR